MGSVAPSGLRWMLCVALAWLTSCERVDGPQLLSLHSASPRLLEAGATLSVAGEGFPEQRAGELTLEGVALSPGRRPEDVTWTLRGVALSSAELSVALNAEELRRLTDGAEHVTFRGDLRVRFAAQRAGAPQLRGRLDGLSFDLFSMDRAGPRLRAAQGFPAFLGLQLAPDLSVVRVEPGSEAALSGLRAEDRLHSLDGVHLLGLTDFVPAPHGVTSSLEYSRPGFDGRAQVLLARAAFSTTDPFSSRMAVMVTLAVVLGLLLAARPPRALLWLASGRRAHPTRRGHSQLARSARALLDALCLVTVSAGLWARLRTSGTPELDLPLTLALGLTPLLVAAFLAGGVRVASRPPSFSLFAGLLASLGTLLGTAPVVLSAAVCASEAGSLRLLDFVRVQGPSPLSWGLVRSPLMTLLGIAFFLCLVPSVGRRPPVEGHPGPPAPSMATALETLGQVLLLGLWVLLFAGGSSGVSLDAWQAGAILGVKVLVAVWTLRLVARRTGHLRRSESWPLWGLPLCALSAVVAAVAFLALRTPLVFGQALLLQGFGVALAAALPLFLSISTLRSLSHHGRQTDPWM